MEQHILRAEGNCTSPWTESDEPQQHDGGALSLSLEEKMRNVDVSIATTADISGVASSTEESHEEEEESFDDSAFLPPSTLPRRVASLEQALFPSMVSSSPFADARRPHSSNIHTMNMPPNQQDRAIMTSPGACQEDEEERGRVHSVESAVDSSSGGPEEEEIFEQEHCMSPIISRHQEENHNTNKNSNSTKASLSSSRYRLMMKLGGGHDEEQGMKSDDGDSLIGDYAVPGKKAKSNPCNIDYPEFVVDQAASSSFVHHLYGSAYDQIFSRFGLTPDNASVAYTTSHKDVSPGRTIRTEADDTMVSDDEVRKIPSNHRSRRQHKNDNDMSNDNSNETLWSTKIWGPCRLDAAITCLMVLIVVALVAAISAAILQEGDWKSDEQNDNEAAAPYPFFVVNGTTTHWSVTPTP